VVGTVVWAEITLETEPVPVALLDDPVALPVALAVDDPFVDAEGTVIPADEQMLANAF